MMTKVFGLDVVDIEEGYVPVEVLVFVKTMDGDGNDCWARRGTDGISDQEAIGIMHCDIQRITASVNGHWISDEDDE